MAAPEEVSTVIWGMPPAVFAAFVTGTSLIGSAIISFLTAKSIARIPKELDFFEKTINRYETVRAQLAGLRQKALAFEKYSQKMNLPSGSRTNLILDYYNIVDSLQTVINSNSEMFSTFIPILCQSARRNVELDFEDVDQVLSSAFEELGEQIKIARKKMGARI